MLNFDQIHRFHGMPTPFYYYDMNLLEETLERLSSIQKKRKIKIHYAVKANANLPILRAVKTHGLGADCVSGNEITRALEAGIHPQDIVFAGVGKTDAEIKLGLTHRISCFNVESIHELNVINEISQSLNTIAPVAFRINPDLDGGTHKHITTGTRFDKFGMPIDEIPFLIEALKNLPHIHFKGLHFHIGSQITDLEIFSQLTHTINYIQDSFISEGFPPAVLNLGGGLGIDYQDPGSKSNPDFNPYFDACLNGLNRLAGQEVHFELGRAVVANCGSLITRILYLKENGGLTFAIVDAGMNDLIRPALYQASHKIQCLTGIGLEKKYQVVGPVCESSDVFGKNIVLPEIQRGDLLAIRSTGAYGESMASGYNLRTPAPAIYSNKCKSDNLPALHIANTN